MIQLIEEITVASRGVEVRGVRGGGGKLLRVWEGILESVEIYSTT